MAIDAFMIFVPAKPGGVAIDAESQTTNYKDDDLMKGFANGKVFEVSDFSFDVEQVLNIGSATQGAGAGKITFNPFTFSRPTDRASPLFFTMCCAGTHFAQISLAMRKATGADGSGKCYLRFDFALAAVKTVSWSGSDGDESTKEEVTFEYGALQIRYKPQDETGALGNAIPAVWSRVNNVQSYTVGATGAPATLIGGDTAA